MLSKRDYLVLRASLKCLGFKSYNEYLNSDMWKNIRKKAFENKKNECFICKKITNLQVHHIKYGYKNLTMLTNGLRIVCNNCHKEIHLFSGNVNRKTRKYKNTCLSGMY